MAESCPVSNLEVAGTTAVYGPSDNDEVDSKHAAYVNEVLCFLQQKCNIIPVDDLVKLCADYYTAEEIEQARLMLSKFVSKKRIGKPKGSGKEVAARSVSAMLKLCLDPQTKLPVFCAMNISRLPPVDVNHIDVSALLQELSLLRREVRAMMDMKQEVAQLRQMMTALNPVSQDMAKADKNIIPSESQVAPASSGVSAVYEQGKISFSAIAAELRSAGGLKPARQVSKPIIGASAGNKFVKAVTTTRTVDVFVSRLHPMTSEAELQESVNFVKGDLNVHEVICAKLPVKFEHLYSSFHVLIRVDASDMKKALDLYMSDDAWPTGVFVRRYFKPKDGAAKQS
jgi:hypothetical protein